MILSPVELDMPKQSLTSMTRQEMHLKTHNSYPSFLICYEWLLEFSDMILFASCNENEIPTDIAYFQRKSQNYNPLTSFLHITSRQLNTRHWCRVNANRGGMGNDDVMWSLLDAHNHWTLDLGSLSLAFLCSSIWSIEK
jgi:hypothetical protein